MQYLNNEQKWLIIKFVSPSCLMNCHNRVVPGRKLSLMASCSSCSPQVRESLTYTWVVDKEVGGARQQVNNQGDMLATGKGYVVRGSVSDTYTS